MNTEALFLFLILLLGLVLCSFLGGDCNREGFTGKFSGTLSIDDDDAIQLKRGNKLKRGNNVSGAAAGAPTNYDNYNHYTGKYSNLLFGSTYYGPDGSSIFVQTNTDGTQKLKVLLPGASNAVMFEQKLVQDSSSNILKEKFTDYSSYVASGTAPVFYGPNGAQASVVVGPQGEQAIKVTTTAGTYYYSSLIKPDEKPSQPTMSSTQYFGATGSSIQTSQAASAYQTYTPYSTVSTPPATTSTSTPATTSTSTPAASTSTPATTSTSTPAATTSTNPATTYTPYSNVSTSAATSTSTPATSSYQTYTPYSTLSAPSSASALPAGIPRSQIPSGQEDLYILKTEVVPPVCPVCPASPAAVKQELCPPCPACARCPESAFECKKVPNYNAMNGGQYGVPTPVLNDFSQFGM